MRVYGLIGFPLTHSFSEEYFQLKFHNERIQDAEYKLFPVKSLTEVNSIIKDTPELLGLNVTIPYKEKILPYLDEIDETAKKIGAVNTIKIVRTPNHIKLKGYNTDIIGFQKSLKNFIGNNRPETLVLGNGGSSKAVQYALDLMHITYKVVSRVKNKDTYLWQEINKKLIEGHFLIINTTPLGMYPEESQQPPLPYEFLGPDHALFDLIYNPPFTQFLMQGNAKNARIKNGLEMLELQADASWELWNS